LIGNWSDLIDEQMLEETVFEQIVFKFMKGCYFLFKENDDFGISLMKEAIDLFEETGTLSAAGRYKTSNTSS